jgi:hypothetical protein
MSHHLVVVQIKALGGIMFGMSVPRCAPNADPTRLVLGMRVEPFMTCLRLVTVDGHGNLVLRGRTTKLNKESRDKRTV